MRLLSGIELAKALIIENTQHSENECWEWQRSVWGNNGYGCAYFQGRHYSAHRLSFAAFVGEIPDHLIVRHSCDNPLCCNPAHLSLGTMKDNARDRDERGRSAPHDGENNGASKITESIARQIFESSGSQRFIAHQFGVSQRTVWRIKNRKSWSQNF